MTTKTRTWLLRTDGVWLALAATGGLWMDISAAFFGTGPAAGTLSKAPEAAIGFVEAHGLAMVLAVTLLRASADKAWHLTAAGVHLLLGICNVTFWQMFVSTNTVPMGWITTGFHFAFAALQLVASASRNAPWQIVDARLAR
jgi:hypothetical protein